MEVFLRRPCTDWPQSSYDRPDLRSGAICRIGRCDRIARCGSSVICDLYAPTPAADQGADERAPERTILCRRKRVLSVLLVRIPHHASGLFPRGAWEQE